MSIYSDTVTLFNKKLVDRFQGPIWYPTVLKNVNLSTDRAVIVAQYGQESSDKAVLNVRYTKIGDEITVAGKPYMEPKEWDQTEDSITFAHGDFFWEGEWGGGIVEDINYTGGFYAYMNEKHDNVFLVTGAARLSVIPHFEIVGR